MGGNLQRFTHLNRGYVVISDKDGDDWSHSRIVPLTENFLNHWAYYLRHRRHVVRNVETYLGEPDPGHVFFFLSTSDTCIFWPIPITDSGLIRSPILELCDH